MQRPEKADVGRQCTLSDFKAYKQIGTLVASEPLSETLTNPGIYKNKKRHKDPN